MKIKKMFSGVIAVILVMTMLAGIVGAADYDDYTAGADDLKSLGLFLGTDVGYELDRTPTRAEAAAMLVRLLGKESEAFEKNYEHPFTDVRDWADPYMGYLYENNLTKGMGNNKFGSADLCDGQMFCTFVLRSLGYTEDDGDFEYEEAIDFAIELGLVDLADSDKDFYRGDCVDIMLNVLMTNIKGTEITLLEKLVTEGAVDAEAAIAFAEKYFVENSDDENEEDSEDSEDDSDDESDDENDDDGDTGDENDNETENPGSLTEISTDKKALVDELTKLMQSFSIYNTSTPYSMDFEMTEDWTDWYKEETKGSISVIGGNYAAHITSIYYGETETISEYYKDGYLYIDYGDGDKIKYDDIDYGYITYMVPILDFDNFDIMYDEIGSIEKSVSGNTVSYKITPPDDFDDDYSFQGFMTFTFNLKGEFISMDYDIKLYWDGELEAVLNYSMKITATGDSVKLNFPDFSDYEEY